jgi:nitroreductase
MKKYNKFFNFLRVFRTFLKTRSFKRAQFYWYELDRNISNFDDDMLLTQLGYFGHHTEKALKHHNRGNRGLDKRDKLELIVKEVEKRNIDESKVINWAKHLIKYFDTHKEIYLKPIIEIKEQKYKDEILDFIKTRTTTRFWQPKEVDDKIIESILEIAMNSALSCNRQSIKFSVVKNKIENMIIGDSNNQSMFEKSPIVIYVADDSRFFPEKYGNALDVGGVCSLIQLVASAYGLSGSWIYHSESYEQNNLKKELGFEEYMYIYSSITIGYPLDRQEKPPRFNISRFIV